MMIHQRPDAFQSRAQAGVHSGVRTEHVDLTTADGVADCYLARPAGPGRYPPVLFYMDVLGLRPALFAMAERVAAAGYLVVMPNVFYREGRAPQLELGDLTDRENRAGVIREMMVFLADLDPDGVMADAAVYLDHLDAHPASDHGPVGVVGYCMGGNLALRTAGSYPQRVAVMASFHGGDLATTSPHSPHRLADRVQARLYFAHAQNDPSAPVEQLDRLHAALQAAGVDYSSEVYPGCAHGFTMSDSPAFHNYGAQRHWEELLALLAGLRPR